MSQRWVTSHAGESTPPVEQEVRWALLLRAIMLTGAVAIAVVISSLDPGTPAWLPLVFVTLCGACGLVVLSSIRGLWQRFPTTLRVGQFLVDACIVTTVVWATGGPGSPLLTLYLPFIMLVALLTNRAVALAYAMVTAGIYALLLYALFSHALPTASESHLLQVPSGGVLPQVLGLWSGMTLVAVAVSFLLRRLKLSHTLVADSQRALSLLSDRQRELVDNIPDPIVAFNIDGTIASTNKAAQELFGCDARETIGKKLDDIVAAVLHEKIGQDHFARKTGEVSVLPQGASEPIRLTFTRRELLDAHEMLSGGIITFKNVTALRTMEEQLALQERMARLLADSDSVSSAAIPQLADFVGESPIMQKVFQLIRRVAPSDATVLIFGESGTGKELVARALHFGGKRAHGPFVAVNCGAIPENLIESELFGHKKGSFTGADQDTTGLMRQADGGTIFLDEVGELPLHLQAKLLRTIQERTVRAVGGSRDIPVDVRIVAATNKNLRAEVVAQRFRDDLFYRLNVINISLPPLRDRKEDLPILITALLKKNRLKAESPVVSPAAMQLLLNYPYPGNVRELENTLERACVLGGEVILPEHLPEQFLKSPLEERAPLGAQTTTVKELEEVHLPAELDSILATIERRYLEAALLKAQGGKKRAAELLGINFRSLRYRLQKFGMQGGDDAGKGSDLGVTK